MTQCALITGTASGIGRACREYFQQKGWRVIGLDKVKTESVDLCLDLSKPSEFNKLKDYLQTQKCSLDAIVHSAAVQVEKDLLSISEEEWDMVMEVNLKAIWRLVRLAISHLQPQSSIVNISSVHASATSPKMSAYATSKGALVAFTRAMALELAPYQIRVNCVSPGAIDTPMLQKGLGRNSEPSVARKKLEDAAPLKRIGTPEDVAHLVEFLCNKNLSANITGQEFICDSGVMARLPSE